MELDRGPRRSSSAVSARRCLPVAGEGGRAAIDARARRRRPGEVPRRVGARPRGRVHRRPILVGPAAAAGAPVTRPARTSPRCAAPCGRMLHVDDASASPSTRLPVRPGPARPSALTERAAPRCACWSPRSPSTPSTRTTPRRRHPAALGAPAGARRTRELLGAARARRPRARGRWTPTPMSRCRSTPATRASRSSPPSVSATGAKVAPWQTGVYWARDARADLLAFTLDKTTAASRRRPGTGTTRSARPSSTGRASRRSARTARPACATAPPAARLGPSCCSRACAPTTGRSGSWDPPPTGATRASGRWGSPGGSGTTCRGPVRVLRGGGGVGLRRSRRGRTTSGLTSGRSTRSPYRR